MRLWHNPKTDDAGGAQLFVHVRSYGSQAVSSPWKIGGPGTHLISQCLNINMLQI